jgi:hypothetical protein
MSGAAFSSVDQKTAAFGSSYQTINNALFFLFKTHAAMTLCIPGFRALRSKAHS